MIEFGSEIIKYKRKKKAIIVSIIVGLLILTIILISMYILKYQVEGEKKLPFEITNILIVSTADGIGKDDKEIRWNLSILQNNDIYIEIQKNSEDKKFDTIKKITLQNFVISNGPKEGEPKIYHPVDDKDIIYLYKDENIIMDKIEYNVASSNNVKKMEIARNGGIISFSSCSTNIASYLSNDDTEVNYDGKLLNKVGILEEEVKYDISFDILIEMDSKKQYKGTIKLSLPLENISTKGTVQMELQDFSGIVFKRIQ